MLDSLFWWSGAIVWCLAGLAMIMGGVLSFYEFVIKKMGLFMKIVLAAAQRDAEAQAIKSGDASDLAYAHRLLNDRVREAQKRRGVQPKPFIPDA